MATESRIKIKCLNFADDTTINGLKNISDSTGKTYRRVIWLLLLLSALALLLFYFIEGLKRYVSYPTTTRLNLFEDASLPFPVVTICNNNMITNAYLVKNPLIGNATGIFAPIMKTKPTMNLFHPKLIDEMKGITYQDIFVEGSHKAEDMFFHCAWNNIEFNCSEKFVPVFTDTHGLCLSFNANGDFITRVPGNLYGLEVTMEIQQYLYSHMATSLGGGIKVVVHETGSVPEMDTNALLLPNGITSEIVVFRKKDIFLPKPYDGPGCYNGEEYGSLTDCKIQCYNKYLASQCHCQYLPITDLSTDYRPCSLYEFTTCIASALDVYRTDNAIEEECGCLHNCEEVGYDVRQSHMLYPSKYAAGYYNEEMGEHWPLQEQRDNDVHFKIYFGNLLTTVTEQVSSYSFTSFSAEIGGYMGLCVGASLLTLTELLEFLFLLIPLCRKHKAAVDSTSSNDDVVELTPYPATIDNTPTNDDVSEQKPASHTEN